MAKVRGKVNEHTEVGIKEVVVEVHITDKGSVMHVIPLTEKNEVVEIESFSDMPFEMRDTIIKSTLSVMDDFIMQHRALVESEKADSEKS